MARGVDLDGALSEVVAIGWFTTHLLPLPVLSLFARLLPSVAICGLLGWPVLLRLVVNVACESLEDEGCDIK